MKLTWTFWWRWMVAAAALVLLVGVALLALPGPTRQLFNWLYFGAGADPASFSREALRYLALVYAVLGSVLAGWGVTLLWVVAGPFRRRAPEGWKMVAWSLLAWLVPDTVASLWLGFWQNAVLNGSFGVLFGVPLIGSYRYFFGAPALKEE